jgi:hypothetical protein
MAWVLGAFFILCIIGSWIGYIRSHHNPIYLNRRHFEDLKCSIRAQLHNLHSHGIPDAYIGRYEKLTYADYPQYRKGIRQLVKDMKNNGIDVKPMGAMVESITDSYYDK